MAMVAQFFLYLGILSTKHLSLMIALWFTIGLLSSIRVQVGYVYLLELMPKKGQTPVTSIWNVQEVMIYVLAIIYFWKISTHWFWFCLFGLVFQSVSVILMFWVPESPRFLITSGKYDEARKSLTKISKFNGAEFEWDITEFLNVN